jgi:hypothetical protein
VSVSLLALLGLGAGIGLALVELCIRRSDFGAWLVLGLLILSEADIIEDLALLTSPVRVGPADVLVIVLSTAAIARLLRIERLTVPQRLLLVFGVLVIWALIRGIGDFGIASPTNEARRYLRFTAAALYFSTVPPDRALLARLGRIWVVTALALAAVSLIRWVGNSVGITGGLFGDGSSLRVVGAEDALIIAQGALITLPLVRHRAQGALRYTAPVLLGFVLILQHRTIWVVAAVGTMYLLYRERAFTPRLLAAFGVGAMIFAVLTFTIFDDDEVDLSDQLAESSQSTGTFEWRVEGWNGLLRDSGPESFSEVVLGQPFGRGWDRRMSNGVTVTVSPHNFYLETYLRVGIAGVVVILALYAIALLGMRSDRRESTSELAPPVMLSPSVLQAVVGVQLLYYVTYSPNEAQAVLLGIACAAAVHQLSRERGETVDREGAR